MGRMVSYGYNPFTGEYDIPLDEEDLAGKEEKENHTVQNTAQGTPSNMPLTGVFHSDPVNHPSHYTSGKIEVIDFIEDQKLDFHLANAVKYICRAGKKNPEKTQEDLEKAVWYINRYIGHVLNGGDAA